MNRIEINEHKRIHFLNLLITIILLLKSYLNFIKLDKIVN